MDKKIKNKTNMYIFLTLEYPNECVTGIDKIKILEDVVKVNYHYAWKHNLVGWIKESTTIFIDKNKYISFLNNTLMEGIK